MRFIEFEKLLFADTDLQETRELISTRLQENRTPELWLTFNLDFLRICQQDSYFYSLCKAAQMIFPDGYGVLHLIKAAKGKILKRITGNDFLKLVLEEGNKLKIRCALIGASEEVLNKLINKVKKEYPDLQIAAAISPPYGFEKNPDYNNKLIAEIFSSKPDAVLAALGTPKQEIWLFQNKDAIGAKLNIGVGASFDFFTGEQKRSPVFLQNLSLEWFWRVLHEPRRLFKRYFLLDLPLFIKKYLYYKFRR